MKGKFCVIVFGVIFILVTNLFAVMTGKVSGTVRDADTGQPLPGANIVLEGTALGAATNRDGEYYLPRVPAGEYTLFISYIGYKNVRIPITVMSNQTTRKDIKLNFEVVKGEEVIVTAQLEGQAAAINRQLSSNTITNVVSAERIQELPDVNAAESVGRLAGISIKRSGGEGQQVVVRGLAPTYNTVTISGEQIPATDLDDRSVDLNMISPEILAGIEVTKALTPDQEANSFGGTIDFQLAEAPGGGFRGIYRYQSGYNDQQTEFGQYRGSLIVSNRFLNDRLGVLVTANLDRAQRGSDQLNASYEIKRAKREGEERAPIAITNLKLIDRIEVRKRFGGSILFDYKLPNGKLRFSNFMSRLDRDELLMTNRYRVSSNWHEYIIRDRDIQVDVLTNSVSGEHSFRSAMIDWRLSRSSSLRRHPFDNQIRFQEKSAFDTRKWPEEMGPDTLIATAFNNIPETFMYQGDLKRERKSETDLAAQTNIEIPYNLGKYIVGYLKLGGRFRGKSSERDRGLGNRRLDLPFGTDIFERHHSRYGDPDFDFLAISGADDASILNYLDPGFNAEPFLGGDYGFGLEGFGGLDRNEIMFLTNSLLLDTVYNTSARADIDDFELSEKVSAGYIMTEINLGPRLMILPGVRYEYTQANMTGRKGNIGSDDDEPDLDRPNVRDTTATNTYSRWFPQLHIRYRLTNWFDIRLARTRSLSRPQLDWMLPKKNVLGNQQKVVLGRPDLKPQISNNYDVFLSFYSNRIGLLTIGGFYKRIEDLIFNRAGKVILDAEKEGFTPDLKGLKLDRPENNEKFDTEVKGFEIEWQTNFTWLPSPFNGFILNVNYTHLSSETQYPRSFVLTERIDVFPFISQSVIDTFRIGNMPDQTDDIANIAIGYDKGIFSGRLSMLYQGETLTTVGEQSELDGFTDALIRWDLSVKLDLTEQFSLFFNWNNITDAPDRSFQQISRFPTAQEFFGMTSDLGLRYEF